MINKLIKAVRRLFRIIILRRKVFGSYGKGNKFEWGVFVNEGAELGSNNYIGPHTMINYANIGNYCSIGPSVRIGQGRHSKDFVTTYQKISNKLIGHSLNQSKTIIGNDVWVGANAVIMQEVKIGNGAIIGANAVVTKDVPEFSIVVGVPAKILKSRFTEEQINIVKESNWYNYEFEKAIEIINEIKLNFVEE